MYLCTGSCSVSQEALGSSTDCSKGLTHRVDILLQIPKCKILNEAQSVVQEKLVKIYSMSVCIIHSDSLVSIKIKTCCTPVHLGLFTIITQFKMHLYVPLFDKDTVPSIFLYIYRNIYSIFLYI